MDWLSQPLAALFGYINENNSLVFLGRRDTIEISDYTSEFLSILKLCNGLRTAKEIKEELSGMKQEMFEAMIQIGFMEGILYDSRKLFMQFHSDTEKPMLFYNELGLTELNTLLDKRASYKGKVIGDSSETTCNGNFYELVRSRKSSRSFSFTDLPPEILYALLKTAYGSSELRPTPSAGSFYPLRLVFWNRTNHKLFEFDPFTGCILDKEAEVDSEYMSRCLDTTSEVNGTVFFVIADLAHMSKKYANRSYRFVFLESGHVAQNMYLFASESKLACLELGSFDDKLAAEMLGLNYPVEIVTTVMVVGYPGVGTPQFSDSQSRILAQLKQSLVGKTDAHPVESLTLVEGGQKPFSPRKFVAVAQLKPVRDLKSIQTTGLSTGSNEAQLKALVEAYERFVSSNPRVDLVASAKQLQEQGLDFADPRKIVPYTNQQLKNYGKFLRPFYPNAQIAWTKGIRYGTQQTVFVPVELVYYPLPKALFKTNRSHIGSSSGVAAHSDWLLAKDAALLELIERDAIAVMWYGNTHPTAIGLSDMDPTVNSRLERWNSLGWKTRLLDLRLDSVPVVLAVFWSESRYPHFTVGSAAATTYHAAAAKAIDEAEIMVAAWKGRRSRISKAGIRRPLDHARFYHQKRNLESVRHLLETKLGRLEDREYDLAESWQKFDPIIIDLARPNENVPLYVVRVISERLLPINFGYGMEHIDHTRLRMLGLTYQQDYPALPHILA